MLENVIEMTEFNMEKDRIANMKSEIEILSELLQSVLEKDEMFLVKRFLKVNNELVEREKTNSFKLALMLGMSVREVSWQTGLEEDEVFKAYVRR